MPKAAKKPSAKKRSATKTRASATPAPVLAAAVSAKKPKKDFSDITDAGLDALTLAAADRDALTARLPAGLLGGLSSDLRALDVAVPAAIQAKVDAKVSTAERNHDLETAAQHVTAIRNAVETHLSKSARRGYGVGTKMDHTVVKQVVAAINTILARAAEHTVEIRAAGVVDTDLEALKHDLTAIDASKKTQRDRTLAKPQATKERNRAANRILFAVRAVSSAGVLAFASNGEKRDEYAALVGRGSHPAPKKKPAKPTPPVAAAPAT
jgi:hypothetical protein